MTDVRPGPSDDQSAGLSRRGFLGRGAMVGAAAAIGVGTTAPVAVAAPGAQPASGPLRAGDLTTEYAATLLGTDVARPRLGWVLSASGHNATQTAYQVQVASSAPALGAGQADVWDSGRVAGADTVGVAYAGPALQPRTRYHWRVRAWDARQRASAWSAATWFETAMTDPAEWVAAWVGTAPSEIPKLTLAGASWIWSPGATTQSAPLGTRYFRGRFAIPAGTAVKAARLVATADDDFTLWLDGRQTLFVPQQTDAWRSARAADVTDQIRELVGGVAVLAVAATNRGSSPNAAGLIAKLEVTTESGDALVMVTDGSWRVTDTVPDGWQAAAFDDSGWAGAVVLAPYGQGPWGSGVTVPDVSTAADLSGANWVWSPGATQQNAPVGTAYFRGRLALPAGTEVQSAQLIATADDDFTLWVDGMQVLAAPQQTDGWRAARLADLTEQLRGGAEAVVVAASATNRPGPSVNPAGLIVKLVVLTSTGEQLVRVTDGSWRSTRAPADGWQQPSFDDSGWDQVVVLAPYGQGAWGSQVSLPPPEQPAPLLRRTFRVDKPVTRARLYVSGVAYHELWLDGRRVGDAVLDPGFTDYDDTVLYVTYDVTKDLSKKGEHVLGAELGRGFYGMTTPNVWNWHVPPWHGDPRLILQLEIDHPDGTRTTVATDEEWRITDGPTRSDSLYSGETYDARHEQPGWTRTGFDDTGWAAASRLDAPKGRLRAQQHEPIRAIADVPVARWSQPNDEVWVADFGRTMAGWARLRVDAPAGAVVSMLFGEKLDASGRVIAANGLVQSPRFQLDEYVSAGDGPRTWEARFSYKGFRYVQVAGLPSAPGSDTLKAIVVGSDVASTAEFTCSEPMFQTFDRMMRRTIHNNLHGIPTDTPKYEKNGWTGDAQVGAITMAVQFDMARFFTKWLGDIADSQIGSGQVPVIIPSGGWGYQELAPSPEWTTVFPFLVREMHRWYGDTRLIETHWATLVRYLDWELGRLQNGLAVTALGDYLSPGTGGNPPEDTRLTATAFLYRALHWSADAGDLVGHTADASRFRAAAASLRDRLNETFLDRTKGHYATARDPGYRQTSNAIPLAFGIVPDDMVRPVVDSLVGDIRSRGMHHNTGNLGTEVLLPVLTEHGHVDVAFAVARQTTYPSWGFWLENGADTMWEFWSADARSRDHYFQGTVTEWLYFDVAGLRPVGDGWRRIVVRPAARGDLSSARLSVRTVRGQASSEWSRHGKTLHLEVEVPVGSTAEVHVPAAATADVTVAPGGGLTPTRVEPGFVVYEVGSGRWRFVSRSAA